MIKQVVHAQILIVGDGTETTFSFDLGKVYGLHFLGTAGLIVSTVPQPFTIINGDAVPDSVKVDFITPTATATAAIAKRVITFTFITPPTGEMTVTFDLEFNG